MSLRATFLRHVNARVGDVLDLPMRAPDVTAFETFAINRGWLIDDGEGGLTAAPGVSGIDPIGRIPTAWADGTDEDGNPVRVPTAWDESHHVNVQLSGARVAGDPTPDLFESAGELVAGWWQWNGVALRAAPPSTPERRWA